MEIAALRATRESHCTAIVTVLELTPPIDRTTGTADPNATPAGTCTLTWYSPTVPGASPEKTTFAGTPPMVTVGVVVVSDRVAFEAACPLPGAFVTSPRPVQ